MNLVGSAKGTNTATAPSHAVGDLMIVCATRNSSAVAPSLPSGFTSIGTSTVNTNSMRVGWKRCTSTSDTVGTWTNATEVVVHIYRPSSGNEAAIGASLFSSGSSATASYGGITLHDTSGASWVALFGETKTQSVGISSTPSGFTSRQDELGTGELASFDTNGGVTSFITATESITSGVWKTCVVEIMDVAVIHGGFDPANVTGTLSNSNRTLTCSVANGLNFSVDTNSSGLMYWSFFIDNVGTSTVQLKISNAANSQFWGFDNTGFVFAEFGNFSGAATFTTGDTVDIAYDFTHEVGWYRVNNGAWQGYNGAATTGDPATNVNGGPASIGTGTTAFIQVVSQGGTTAEVTLNTGTATFTNAPPSGFSGWYVPVGGTTNPLSLSITCTTTLTNGNAVSKALSLACTSTLSAAKSVGKALGISSISSVAASTGRLFARTLSIVCTSALGSVRSVGKVLPISAVTALSTAKAIAKTFGISAVSALTATASKTINRTVAITCSSAVSGSRTVAKGLTIASVTATSAVRSVGKRLSIACTSALAALAVKAHVLVLAITCSSAVTHSLSVGKQLAVASVSAVSSARSIGKHLAIASVSALALSRRVGKGLAISCTSALTAAVSRAHILVLSIAVTTSVRASRSIGKRLAVLSTSAVSASRTVGKALRIASVTSLAAVASRTFMVQVTIVVTSSVSQVKTISKTVAFSCVTALTSALQSTIKVARGFAAKFIIGRPVQGQVVGSAPTANIVGKPDPVYIVGQPDAPAISGRPSAPVQIIGRPDMRQG
jgi:hypothetical protein